MKPTGIALLAGALLALTATPAVAQYVVSAKSGTVNYTEGRVLLDGQSVESSLTHYPDIKEGSVLRTEEGRAEVLLTPGVTLRLGDHSSFKMITNRLIDTRLELLSGQAVIEADAIAKDTNVTVVVNNAAVSLPKPGIYHFSFDPAQLKVFKGEAAVLLDSETKLVGAGRTCPLSDTAAAEVKFNPADTDELDNWSHRRGELMAMANVSGADQYNTGSGLFIPSAGGYYPAAYMGGMVPGFGLGFGMPFMGCGGGFMPYASLYNYGFWSYNPWYDMYTYVPCYGMAYSPYGYGFWSPGAVQTVVGSPKRGVGITPGPWRGNPARGPGGLPARPALALAVNGAHSPGFRGGAGITRSYASGYVGRGGFSGFGASSSGSFARGDGGGYSGGGGYSSGVSSGGYSGGGAPRGGFSGGGGAAAVAGGGGGHR
jgi:hypothetical protein